MKSMSLLVGYSLFFFLISNSYADKGLVGSWKLIKENGEPSTQQEILSFDANGNFMVHEQPRLCGEKYGKYIDQGLQSTWIVSSGGRELTVPIGIEVNDDLLLIHLNPNTKNTYHRLPENTQPCKKSDLWEAHTVGSVTLKTPKNWILEQLVEFSGEHIRIMLHSPDYKKIITIVASKKLAREKNLDEKGLVRATKNIGEAMLARTSIIGLSTEKYNFIEGDGSIDLGKWPLVSFYLKPDEKHQVEFRLASTLIQGWFFMAITSQNRDQLKDFKEIFESIRIDGQSLSK